MILFDTWACISWEHDILADTVELLHSGNLMVIQCYYLIYGTQIKSSPTVKSMPFIAVVTPRPRSYILHTCHLCSLIWTLLNLSLSHVYDIFVESLSVFESIPQFMLVWCFLVIRIRLDLGLSLWSGDGVSFTTPHIRRRVMSSLTCFWQCPRILWVKC